MPSPSHPFSPAAFLGRFTLRASLWLACSAAVPYGVYHCEQKAGGGTAAENVSAPRATPIIAEYDSEDTARPSGAIVGYAAQYVPQHRYAVHPVVPFRARFRGFVYESLEGSPVSGDMTLASVRTPIATEECLVHGRLIGFCAPAGVDMTTEPTRLGNSTPVPHPLGGWVLLAGVICLMLLPTQAPPPGRREDRQEAEVAVAPETPALPEPTESPAVLEPDETPEAAELVA